MTATPTPALIPAPHDVAAQTSRWEELKRKSPRAYRQVVINFENRVGESR
ncbi:hypothetical protein ABGB18_11375 [Nonomuraea sp. B12E4]